MKVILSMRVKNKKGAQKQVLKKLDRIERKLGSIRQKEDRIMIEEKKLEHEEEKVEKILFNIGNFEFKRKHVLELIRGTAGAFFGVGIGRNLLNLQDLAAKLPWWNVLGILIFVLFVSGLLIYKNEKNYVKQKGYIVVFRKLILLYIIAIAVELISLWLFKALPPETAIIIKMLVIGSFAAMGGAVTFSIV